MTCVSWDRHSQVDRMTCTACTIAKINPRTSRFDAGCIECSARALAGDPRFHACGLTGALSVEYIAALRSVFGEGWREGHERVKSWSLIIKRATK